MRNKLLKKSSETQVWLTISLLLPTHFPCIWYHWKALLFIFTMMCHLLWLHNLGMCSTPEYGGGCKVKCAKMHCYCHIDNSGVLHIPKLRNHNKWHIIVKRNNRAFQWYQMQGKWVGNKREIVSQTWVSKLFVEEFICSSRHTLLYTMKKKNLFHRTFKWFPVITPHRHDAPSQ